MIWRSIASNGFKVIPTSQLENHGWCVGLAVSTPLWRRLGFLSKAKTKDSIASRISI